MKAAISMQMMAAMIQMVLDGMLIGEFTSTRWKPPLSFLILVAFWRSSLNFACCALHIVPEGGGGVPPFLLFTSASSSLLLLFLSCGLN